MLRVLIEVTLLIHLVSGLALIEMPKHTWGPNNSCKCVNVNKCDEVKKLWTDKKFDELNNNFTLCGFEGKVPKYCCSKETSKIAQRGTDLDFGYEYEYDDDYDSLQCSDLEIDGYMCALSADCMSTEISPNNFATCTEKGETCCAQEDITWLQAVQREDYDYYPEDPNSLSTDSRNEKIQPLTCTTTSGPDSDKPCIFPFKFAKVTYNKCTTEGNEPGDNKAWCSTKVDESGNHIGGQGNYGFCEQKCQGDEKKECKVAEIKSGEQKPCSFPFYWKGVKNYGCTNVDGLGKYWCSTKTIPGTFEHDETHLYFGDCNENNPECFNPGPGNAKLRTETIIPDCSAHYDINSDSRARQQRVISLKVPTTTSESFGQITFNKNVEELQGNNGVLVSCFENACDFTYEGIEPLRDGQTVELLLWIGHESSDDTEIIGYEFNGKKICGA